MIRKRRDLRPYQKYAVDHIIVNAGSMLWLDIGLGKTVTALTAIEYLLDAYEISAALVVAPKKVAEAVWEQEAEEWEHTRRLKFSMVMGTPKQREQALLTPANVYVINYDNLQWLAGGTKKSPSVVQKLFFDNGRPLPFDMVVFDEISKMKSSRAKRSKAFANILPYFRYRVGLTGSPASNGLIDLHGQYLMIDGGERLGPNITYYRNRWFVQNLGNHRYTPRAGASKEIQGAIRDITIEMKQQDYLTLPGVIDQDITIPMPDSIKDQYRAFEDELFLELDAGGVEAFNAGAKSMKCRQLANGAVYLTDMDDGKPTGQWAEFHDLKLQAVEEVVEELNGKPLLVCYQFRHDVERLLQRFPQAVFLDASDTRDKIRAWNAGRIEMMIGHPKSMGHGLNLQKGGNHILWFGVPWELELYEQAIGRLKRSGQEQVVINHRVILKGTVEVAVLAALDRKAVTQNELRDAIKQYRGMVQPISGADAPLL